MAVTKPFFRTVRMNTKGNYSSPYVRHEKFVIEPARYIRAFLLLQKDVQELFEFVEPADQNAHTFSLRIHELLVRTCIEVEANLKGILTENKYSNTGNLTMSDYSKVEQSHFLSRYKIWVPYWKGNAQVRVPFGPWKCGKQLNWYQSYNKSKHDRHRDFEQTTFNYLLDAISGLVVVLSAQFNNEDFSPKQSLLALAGGPTEGYDHAVGSYFGIQFPSKIPDSERYDFDWQQLKVGNNPFQKFDYDNL